MDALDKKAFNELVAEGVPFKQAREEVPSRANTIFERDYERPLQHVTHKPKCTVQLRGTLVFLRTPRIRSDNHHLDMDKPDRDCGDLIRGTAEALDGPSLQLLSLSVQRNSMESRVTKLITK